MTRGGELRKVNLAETDKQKNRVSVSVTFTFYLMVKSMQSPKFKKSTLGGGVTADEASITR